MIRLLKIGIVFSFCFFFTELFGEEKAKDSPAQEQKKPEGPPTKEEQLKELIEEVKTYRDNIIKVEKTYKSLQGRLDAVMKVIPEELKLQQDIGAVREEMAEFEIILAKFEKIFEKVFPKPKGPPPETPEQKAARLKKEAEEKEAARWAQLSWYEKAGETVVNGWNSVATKTKSTFNTYYQRFFGGEEAPAKMPPSMVNSEPVT